MLVIIPAYETSLLYNFFVHIYNVVLSLLVLPQSIVIGINHNLCGNIASLECVTICLYSCFVLQTQQHIIAPSESDDVLKCIWKLLKNIIYLGSFHARDCDDALSAENKKTYIFKNKFKKVLVNH